MKVITRAATVVFHTAKDELRTDFKRVVKELAP